MRALLPNGKPMCALRALAETSVCEPMTEYDVYRACQRQAGRSPASWTQSAYHAALQTLVQRGLAERCGSRGLGQWFITGAGREKVGGAERKLALSVRESS